MTEQEIVDTVKANNLNFMDVFVLALAEHLHKAVGDNESVIDLYLKAIKNKWEILETEK